MTSSTPYSYEGSELEVFSHATVWKRYLRAHVTPHLGEEVLEVGAGRGTSTRALFTSRARRWVCLEPDAEMARCLARDQASGALPSQCEIVTGTVEELEGPFDSILYIDVLEHIEADRKEITRAAGLLRPGGQLVVLSPAHEWLFTPFDQAIGHHRRYTRKSLRKLTPSGLTITRAIYLDSVGMLASLANRLLLKSPEPTLRQVVFWDRFLVRTSTLLDRLLGYRVGKSVLTVWTKDAPEE